MMNSQSSNLIQPGTLEFIFAKYFVNDGQIEEAGEAVVAEPVSLIPEYPTQPTAIGRLQTDPVNAGTTKITSMNLMDNEDFKRDMHIAEVVEKFIRQMYPHVVNPPEAARLDNRHPWEVKNDRYKEFIEFYKQYQLDLKRVSYN